MQNQLCEDLSGFRMSVNYRVGESRNLTGLYIPARFEYTPFIFGRSGAAASAAGQPECFVRIHQGDDRDGRLYNVVRREVQMIRSIPGRLLLALALIVLVLGSAGCARSATPTPPSRAGATPTVAVATATAVSTPEAPPTAASAPQARPTATPSRSPTAGATAAPIPGGLVIATPPPGDRMPAVRVDRLPPEALDTIRLIAAKGPFPYRQDGVVFENR